MSRHRKLAVGITSFLVVSAVVVGIATAAVPLVKDWWKRPPTIPAPASVQVVRGKSQTFEIPESVANTLGLDRPTATADARPASHPRSLELTGTLALDTNYLARIHSRFAGEVVKIGDVETVDEHDPARNVYRAIRFGDRVRGPIRDSEGNITSPGQLLVEIWSKDLGEKKSELVEAVCQFRLDQETLVRLQKFANSIPERAVREQEAKVAQDRNAVFKAERTLRVWRLSDAEIEDVKKEADTIFKNARDTSKDAKEMKLDQLRVRASDRVKEWGKVEVRASFSGTVLEKNVAVGDIVDTAADLFKIADLRHLSVWAHAYEEDLPRLLALKPEQRRWTVTVISPDSRTHALRGTITKIGDIIDPSQHTALIMGHVENPQGFLRAGQFVTAAVQLPPDASEVEIPTSALIENGANSVVLVQPDPGSFTYTLRKVAVVRRTADIVCLRTHLTPEEQARGLRALRPGDRVVTVGVLELTAAYREQVDSGRK
jgi:cobalt-zinc-cadmium efflux system membrane fusion protein